jgi:hypothetical protein
VDLVNLLAGYTTPLLTDAPKNRPPPGETPCRHLQMGSSDWGTRWVGGRLKFVAKNQEFRCLPRLGRDAFRRFVIWLTRPRAGFW